MGPQTAAAIWTAVHSERSALLQDVEQLTTAQWQTPSLCPGWSVHDVLAHLVDGAQTTRLGFIRRLLAARFDFDRDNALGVAREGAGGPAATVSKFRGVLQLSSTPPVALATRLVEAFVHGEDIRRPLGIHRSYPAAHVVTALDYQLKTAVGMGGGRERGAAWQLVASDAHWSHGSGPELRGTATALLLAMSGRPVAGGELTGPGAAGFLAQAGS